MYELNETPVPQTMPTLTTRMTGSPTRTRSTPPMMRPPYPTPPPRPSSMTPRLTPRPLPASPRPCSGTSQARGAAQEAAPHLSSPTGGVHPDHYNWSDHFKGFIYHQPIIAIFVNVLCQ